LRGLATTYTEHDFFGVRVLIIDGYQMSALPLKPDIQTTYSTSAKCQNRTIFRGGQPCTQYATRVLFNP